MSFFSQWARIVLTTERMLTPAKRLAAQKKYSQGLGSDGKRALIMRLRNHENRQQVWRCFMFIKNCFIKLKGQGKPKKKTKKTKKNIKLLRSRKSEPVWIQLGKFWKCCYFDSGNEMSREFSPTSESLACVSDVYIRAREGSETASEK